MKFFIVGLFLMSSAFAQDDTFTISGTEKVEAAISLMDSPWDRMRYQETTEGDVCTKILLNNGPSRAKLIVGKTLTSISIKRFKPVRGETKYLIKAYHGASMEEGSQLTCSTYGDSEVAFKLLNLKD